jgi:hypothetical protein
VREVLECRETILDASMRLAALQVVEEANAATVVFALRVIQSLCGGKT